MTVYLQSIDITPEDELVVSGQLSATNIGVQIYPRVYIMEPEDGIWELDILETATGPMGADIMVPFSVKTRFEGANRNGARVFAPGPGGELSVITQRKAKRVTALTTTTENHPMILGAYYEPSGQQLVVDIGYGGGCFEHDFALEWDGTTMESNPVQYPLQLVDLSKYDPCRGNFRRQLRFDLSVSDINLEVPSNIWLSTPSAPGGIFVPGPRGSGGASST